MHQQPANATPAVVSLPAEIDITNADQVYELLMAAAATGAPVVIVDSVTRARPSVLAWDSLG